MNFEKLLASFRRKLRLEAVIRAAVLALGAGAMAVFLLSLLFHLRLSAPHPAVMPCLFGGIALLTFLLSLVCLLPSAKQVAARIDETGLAERTGTMWEYRGDDTEIARIQREDAVRHLAARKPSDLRWHFQRKEFILCAVSVVLALTMVLLPYNLLAGIMVSAADAQANIVRELIDDLRVEMKEAALRREQQEALDKIIDELEEQLREDESRLDQAADMQEAMDALARMLEESITKDEIGEALQRYDMTEDLGEAIENGDEQGVSDALDALEDVLREDPKQVPALSDTLRDALRDAGTEPTDPLHGALEDFAAALDEIDGADVRNELREEMLDEAFAEAEDAIRDALREQAALEEAIAAMQESLEQAKDEMLGREPGEGVMPGEGEMPGEGQMPGEGEIPGEGQMPGGNPPQGDGFGEGEGDGTPPEGAGDPSYGSMTEGIYDPYAGNVEYGEVFASYYKEYLDALADGRITPEEQALLDPYFDALD